jgi:hypothetical protein
MSATQSISIRRFIAQQHIRMTSDWADENPNMDHDDWHAQASHFKCVLTANRRRLTVYFSQGAAISGEPTVETVLDCLASDADTVENAASFEDWADELGYDPDSRRAFHTYQATTRQTAGLRRLLGDTAFEQLLYRVERE